MNPGDNDDTQAQHTHNQANDQQKNCLEKRKGGKDAYGKKTKESDIIINISSVKKQTLHYKNM